MDSRYDTVAKFFDLEGRATLRTKVSHFSIGGAMIKPGNDALGDFLVCTPPGVSYSAKRAYDGNIVIRRAYVP